MLDDPVVEGPGFALSALAAVVAREAPPAPAGIRRRQSARRGHRRTGFGEIGMRTAMDLALASS